MCVKRLLSLSNLLLLLLALPPLVGAQVPFSCEGQVFCIREGRELARLSLAPQSAAITFSTIRDDLGVDLQTIGYRSSDNLLYGIHPTDHRLYRIDATGNVEDLGPLNLQSNLEYKTGTISPDGRFYYTIGSVNDRDQGMTIIDLDSPTFSSQLVPLSGPSISVQAMATDPYTGQLYGYDAESRSVVRIPSGGGTPTPLQAIDDDSELRALFFDAFGDLFGYGPIFNGFIFSYGGINKNTGEVSSITSGGIVEVVATTACPYTVALRATVDPTITFPCAEVDYVYTIANASRNTQTGLDLEHALPPGFAFQDLLTNPYGGSVNSNPGDPSFVLTGIDVPAGVDSVSARVLSDDIPARGYKSQAQLRAVDPALGGDLVSDDPSTASPSDSTVVRIIRFDEDSLDFEFFICTDEEVLIDASIYGSDIEWSTGSNEREFTIREAGEYRLVASSGCQTVVVDYSVSQASCPYTIDIAHDIQPRETLPCSEVIYEYVLGNDSGFPRPDLVFSHQLPPGFTVLEVLENGLGGQVDPLPTEAFRIQGVTLPEGSTSVRLRVEIGDVDRGSYSNQARLDGLPPLMGDNRTSFDPLDELQETTLIEVLDEVESNSTFLEFSLCAKPTVFLDGSPYGNSYLWDDGSEASTRAVSEPGEYELVIVDGCINSFVFFTVIQGDDISVRFPEEEIVIRRESDTLLLPIIQNSAPPDSQLLIRWTDPFATSLSCRECPDPVAAPVQTALYEILVDNGSCRDSATVRVIVEDKRKLYIPNVISPNGDGVNDFFYIQSPDFGLIRSLRVYNRWGALVFESTDSPVDQRTAGWDGLVNGNTSSGSVYVWVAEIEFEDEEVEQFLGDFIVLY